MLLIKSFLFEIEFHKLLIRFRGNQWIGKGIFLRAIRTKYFEGDLPYQCTNSKLETPRAEINFKNIINPHLTHFLRTVTFLCLFICKTARFCLVIKVVEASLISFTILLYGSLRLSFVRHFYCTLFSCAAYKLYNIIFVI